MHSKHPPVVKKVMEEMEKHKKEMVKREMGTMPPKKVKSKR